MEGPAPFIQRLSGNSSFTNLRVGIVQARSPVLSKAGIFIAVFTKQSVFNFHGNLEMRVLGGVVTVEAFAVTPSDKYMTLCIPNSCSSPAVSMRPMDPNMTDDEYSRYLLPFKFSGLVHFHSKSSQHSTCVHPSSCVLLDLGEEDVKNLNELAKKEWSNIAAIALLKPLQNHLTSLLAHHGVGVKYSQQLKGISVAKVDEALYIPDSYRMIAWDLIKESGATILICGDSGTGKSTFGRFLINYFLNRLPAVGYLECDPGQCEFTCPEVLSLHVLTEPVFGLPYNHLRNPLKAYYFGDRTPKTDPEYYIRLLQSLSSHFIELVRRSGDGMPLIINTCGWLCDMGVQLFLDILRSLKPSHIIRLLPKKKYSIDTCKDLPPLTETLFMTTPGLFTPADKFSCISSDSSNQVKFEAKELSSIFDDDSVNKSLMMVDKVIEGEDAQTRADPEDVMYLSSDIEMYGSSEDEFSISEASSDMEETNKKEERKRRKRRLKRRRLHLISSKQNTEKRRMLKERRFTWVEAVEQWVPVLSYRVMCLAAPKVVHKISVQQRRLGLLSYFSPLLSVVQQVAREHNLPDPLNNMLSYAPPLEVSWQDVAIHILHKPVSSDQLLYAFNGKLVCLGRVESEQIVHSSPQSNVFKLIKSRTPLIHFIGLGLLRGIDPVKKLFYITTPLRDTRLDSVNVFVLGNPDSIKFEMSLSDDWNIPYQTKNFKPIELGKYVWSQSRSHT